MHGRRSGHARVIRPVTVIEGFKMKYKIKHGSIAAVQYVTLPDGREITVTNASDEPNTRFLPLNVNAAVNRQFGIIFSLPYASRQTFIDNSVPFEIEAPND